LPEEQRASMRLRVDEFPPIYVASLATLAGDALGNFHVFLDLRLAVLLAVVATILFCVARATGGYVAAFLAITAAATIPVHQLLAPDLGPAGLHRFADDSTITLEGTIARAPEHVGAGRTYLFVDAERAALANRDVAPLSGWVRVTVLEPEKFRIGDEVRTTARIRFPRNDGNPGEFDYRGYLYREGVAATMFVGNRGRSASIAATGHRNLFPGSQVEAVRDRIGAFIDANLAGPKRAEMRALIIGDRGGIDESLRERFALTGMAHLLVISGLHLGFVAAAAFFLMRLVMGFFPSLMARGYANKAAAVAAALAACAYASIAGHHVSTVRALVMVLSYALAILFDRAREVSASLALAALVICLALPGSTADIGFQLSFASVLVIILGMRRYAAWWRFRFGNPRAPLTEAKSYAKVVAEWIVGFVAVSFWALLGTAPLTAYHFNQFSLVGLVANAVVVPIMGFGAVVYGLAAACASFVFLPLARELLWIAGKLAGAGTWLAGWFLAWPLAWTRIFTPTILEIAIVYGLIALWFSLPRADERLAARSKPDLIATSDLLAANDPVERFQWRVAVLVALAILVIGDGGWWTYQRYFNPDLRVTFLSVGEGDGAVVRFPGSRVMVIDGGGAFVGTFDTGERIVAPYLWSNKIMHVDYVALSHPDRDHFGGLTFIARNFSPSEFWTGGATKDDSSYVRLLDAMKDAGARSLICNSASPPMTIGGVSLKCLGPLANVVEIKDNNASMVLRLDYAGKTFLFTGDLEAKGERELIASGAGLRATVLKVPHHGSKTSSSEAFIEAVHPEAAVISVGYHNRFHFPAPDVIERYHVMGADVLRTDMMGAVSAEAGRDDFRLWSFRGGRVALPAK
jgi:competence protein ComEC